MKGRIVLLLITLLQFACHKDTSCDGCEVMQNKEATIFWSGPINADGCDWCVRDAEGVLYHPRQLPQAYRVNDLAVTISFRITQEEFHCGLAGTPMPVIDIIRLQ